MEIKKTLNGLVVGDEVVLCHGCEKSLRKIEDITAAGNIKVTGRLFNAKTGMEKTSNYYKDMIIPVTKELHKEIKDKENRSKAYAILRNISFSQITPEIAEKILLAFDKESV